MLLFFDLENTFHIEKNSFIAYWIKNKNNYGLVRPHFFYSPKKKKTFLETEKYKKINKFLFLKYRKHNVFEKYVNYFYLF